MRLLLFLLLFITINATANTALTELNAFLAQRNRQTVSSSTNQQNAIANHIKDPYQLTINPVVSALRKNYQFMLFYRATCPHCQRFAPILKEYANHSGIAVRAFTFAGVSPYFPASVVVNRDLINTYFHGTRVAVPALFILNTTNGHAYPVSQGELSYAELVARMNQLAEEILHNEARG